MSGREGGHRGAWIWTQEAWGIVTKILGSFRILSKSGCRSIPSPMQLRILSFPFQLMWGIGRDVPFAPIWRYLSDYCPMDSQESRGTANPRAFNLDSQAIMMLPVNSCRPPRRSMQNPSLHKLVAISPSFLVFKTPGTTCLDKDSLYLQRTLEQSRMILAWSWPFEYVFSYTVHMTYCTHSCFITSAEPALDHVKQIRRTLGQK